MQKLKTAFLIQLVQLLNRRDKMSWTWELAHDKPKAKHNSDEETSWKAVIIKEKHT
jgi:hypothetical protein